MIVANNSAFEELGFQESIEFLKKEVQELYLADEIPWVIGYSGGKDSSATLQLVWIALADLPSEKRAKTVHVISTDTMVENPIVSMWVGRSIEVMNDQAAEQELPIQAHQLTPALEDTFWVNLIGKGYPAPRHKFRWCTERLKIKPSNKFITDVVRDSGEAILVLGTRKSESAVRGARMRELEKQRTRMRLTPSQTLANCSIFSPLEEWTNDDVWLFLMQVKNPWGYNNKDLLTMYQGATADGECPLVVDTSTPSCGDSRFGCWVCTLVEEDKSMSAMIQNDEEKEWMLPLLDLRNALDFRKQDPENGDRHLRDFRRMSGHISIMQDGRHVPGPYTQAARMAWLRKVLQAQRFIHDEGPAEVRSWHLITLDELREIRRVWVTEKHEIEDTLPQVYQEEMGQGFPDGSFSEASKTLRENLVILEELAENPLQYEMLRNLIGVEEKYQSRSIRRGLYDDLESAIKKSFYESAEEATDYAGEISRLQRDLRTLNESPEDGDAITAEELESKIDQFGSEAPV